MSRLFSEAWPVIWHDRLGSTNDEARKLALSGYYGPCWIGARIQTGGRGRRGRKWHFEPGNLAVTALLVPPEPLPPAILCVMAGLAVIDALDAVAEPGIGALKWPNDIYWQDSKLGGILIETGSLPEQKSWVAIGIGLNIVAAPELEGRAVSFVRELPGGSGADRDMVMELLEQSLRLRLRRVGELGLSALGQDWIKRCHTPDMRLQYGRRSETGILTGIGDDGSLILTLGSGERLSVPGGDIRALAG